MDWNLARKIVLGLLLLAVLGSGSCGAYWFSLASWALVVYAGEDGHGYRGFVVLTAGVAFVILVTSGAIAFFVVRQLRRKAP